MDFDKLIYEKENVLSKEICDDIINRFENDKKNQMFGVTVAGVNKDVKDTMDLMLSYHDEWKDIDTLINKVVYTHFEIYREQLTFINLEDGNETPIFNFPRQVGDKGYQIQKYKQNEGKYVWHTDNQVNDKGKERLITFLFYLNDIDKGGETDFHYKKIIPRTGKLLLFPATWTFPHRGIMPESSDKYIITGWIHDEKNNN